MTHLGPEWIGRLPPGAQEYLDRDLLGWRDLGVVIGVEIEPGPDCVVAAQLSGFIFPLSDPPRLPIEGCVRSPCCACGYMAVLDDEGGQFAQPARRAKPMIEGPSQ